MTMSHRRQRGFTLIELSVALLVGLFLIGGLLVMLQSNRRSFTSQSQLAQLQDGERLGMTVITDVVQSAGYFPNPVANTATTMLTASVPMVAGQAIYATANTPTTLGDKLTIRFATASGDGVINCNGTTNSSGADVLYSNEFSVTAGNALVCSLNGAPAVELVTGVTNMTVMYGVKRNSAVSNNSVDTYLTVAEMAAADWNNVIALKVSLTFQNPLYDAATTVAQFVTFTRVIGVMNQTGVKL